MAVNRITLRDVAGACGYTVNTVSRALRGDPRLPESTRAKIREAAVRMGYIRNSLASTLRSGRSGNIAVIVNDVHNLHFCNMLTVMDSELRQAGYNIMVLCMGLNEELGEHLIRSAISQSVDGILYFPYMNNPEHIEVMRKNHVPFVLLDRRINDTAKAEFDSVYIDLLPDMEEYRVVPVEEVKARRNELIRYMEEEDERKALKEERKNQKRQKKQ